MRVGAGHAREHHQLIYIILRIYFYVTRDYAPSISRSSIGATQIVFSDWNWANKSAVMQGESMCLYFFTSFNDFAHIVKKVGKADIASIKNILLIFSKADIP